jgi:cytochrome oxidase Cu insertion factor (SCO1/SenC/PrrC family)
VQRRFVVLGLATALGAGAGIGAAVLFARSSDTMVAPSRPAAAWAAGARRAPSFDLTDELGRPVSIAGLRGRSAIVTFIDPVCRDLCPLEARVLMQVARDLGTRAPALVAVSVNPPADTRANFQKDARVWGLTPSWRWAVGTQAELARVWRDYDVGVRVTHKTIAGVTVRSVAHVEAAYVLDAAGYERALFVYPFVAADVEHALARLRQ